jgi:hypothetical protein
MLMLMRLLKNLNNIILYTLLDIPTLNHDNEI